MSNSQPLGADNLDDFLGEDQPDTDTGPLVLGNGVANFVIGYQPELHGPESALVDVQITIHEIEQLCEYWAKEVLYTDESYWYFGESGSREWRMSIHGRRRLRFFVQLIGRERVAAIVNRVYRHFDPPETPGELLDEMNDPCAPSPSGNCPHGQCQPDSLLLVNGNWWAVCDQHKVRWFCGSDRVRWLDMPEGMKNHDKEKMLGYTPVAPLVLWGVDKDQPSAPELAPEDIDWLDRLLDGLEV